MFGGESPRALGSAPPRAQPGGGGSGARRWGIEQTFAPVGRPTGNAVAERTIQTMKVECLWLEDFVDAAQVQAALDRWRHDFNHERPHQALDWRTPAETRALQLGLDQAAA